MHPTRAAAPRTIAEWRSAFGDGDALVAQLADTYAQAQDQAQVDSALGIWIHLCPSAVWLRQIQQLQQRLRDEPDAATRLARWPLLGLPFAVKDNIDIAGEPTTAACPKFAHVAAQDATVVRKLLDAGALWLGKTNLDQFATGLVGTRSPYGKPACVDDEARISGGSSSGSAVAVARGVAPFALGTDTAGSGRIPAGFNGIVGLKPTPGRVSNFGVLAACRTLDCVAVFAHTVDDAAQVLAVIEGSDSADVYSDFAPGPACWPGRVRVGVPQDAQLDAAVGYPQAWSAAQSRAAELGHSLKPVDFKPLFEVAALLYEGPWVAERHASVRELFDTDPEAIDATVRRVISRALGMTATQTFEAMYRLRALQSQLQALWSDIDVLMVPTAPSHPSFADVEADPVGANAVLGRYTNFVNLLGWCALAVPAGRSSAGLPFGVTFIARAGLDAALVQLARRWEGASESSPPSTPWQRSPAVQASLPLVVVGAHLSGLPLNGQLIERGATLLEATTTAARYRLYALPGTTPPKPGLLRVAEGGQHITAEVWAMPQHALGSFLALIPPPLGLGSVELAGGRQVHGFLCEPYALAGALDITHFGGWRPYVASLAYLASLASPSEKHHASS